LVATISIFEASFNFQVGTVPLCLSIRTSVFVATPSPPAGREGSFSFLRALLTLLKQKIALPTRCVPYRIYNFKQAVQKRQQTSTPLKFALYKVWFLHGTIRTSEKWTVSAPCDQHRFDDCQTFSRGCQFCKPLIFLLYSRKKGVIRKFCSQEEEKKIAKPWRGFECWDLLAYI
jgi:hypothetical protein